MSWMNRLSNVLRRRDLNAEIDEELQFHLDARVRDNIAAGMSEVKARREAFRAFGSRSGVREATRAANVLVWLETVGQDLVIAARSLLRRPSFTTVAILTLALGIGANAAIFTVVRSVVLRPLPFPDSDRIALIAYNPSGLRFWLLPGLSDTHYLAFRDVDRTFEATASFGHAVHTLTGSGEAARITGVMVTPGFFDVLRVRPVLGRSFAAEDAATGQPPVVVISDSLWRSRFGADPQLLNRTIVLDGTAHTVVGIMPRGFAFPASAEFWTPLEIRTDPNLTFTRPVIGRLRPDTTYEQAAAAFSTFVTQLPGDPGSPANWTAAVLPLRDALVGDTRHVLFLFAGAVGCVLLITWANVANLLLMRTLSRRREIATRLALGASRARIVRLMLSESVLVALSGGALGALVAIWAIPAILSAIPAGQLPRIGEVRVDGWVALFTIGLSLLTGAVLGLVSAHQATHERLAGQPREGLTVTPSRFRRVRNALVIAEIAVALVLLIGAGLLVKSFLRLRAIDPGFEADRVMTMTVELSRSRYPTTVALRDFHDRMLAELRRLPNVARAAAINWLPLGGLLLRGDIVIDGGRQVPEGYTVTKATISPGYFGTVGIPLRAGRDFTDADSAGGPGVVIVSHAVARALWPNEGPLGRRLSIETPPRAPIWLTVVGIAEDIRQEGLKESILPAIYQPYRQTTRLGFLDYMTFVARTTGNPRDVAKTMRGALAAIDDDQAPRSQAALQDLLARSLAEPRFQSSVVALFSLVAVALAIIGIYGVLSYSVEERRREIGIRVALGADRPSVIWMVLRQTLAIATLGVIAGGLGALALTRILRTFLFDVNPTDVATFVAASGAFITAALIAGLLPARRASAVDPLVVLKE
jgi:putative ABC transport system permease protein